MKEIMKGLRGISKVPMLLTAMLLAGLPAVLAQSKTFSKTYPVSAGASLAIENQFGNVIMHTWNKNQVQANVNIQVDHGNQRKGQELLEAIDIIASGEGNDIRIRTSIGKDKMNLKGNTSIRVNYEVYVPATINLLLVNKFGNTVLPDLQGTTRINQSFGNLETGRLSGKENQLFVEFSEGSTQVGEVRNLEGTFKFSNIEIAGLDGEAKIEVRHCGTFQLAAAPGLSRLDLDADYSDVDFDLHEKLDAAFEVSTHFGDFNYGSNVRVDDPIKNEAGHGPRFNFQYTGTVGSGKNSRLSVNSNFSSITFR